MPDMKTWNELTVLFSGGGTGGHLMPGLTIAEELRRRMGTHVRLVFAGTEKKMERRMVESRGFEFHALPVLRWQGSLNTPRWMARCAGGLLAARKLIRQLRPNLVISLGGHAALAPALAGVLANVPLVIMEQNVVPGKVNRVLSWWAREVHVPWAGSEGSFWYPGRVHVTGNPVCEDIVVGSGRRDLTVGCEQMLSGAGRVKSRLPEPQGRRWAVHFGLSPRKRTLLVLGGSQGARFLNRLVAGALPLLAKEAPWLQILHSTGADGYDETCAAYARSGIQAAVYPFIEDMPAAYAAGDLAFCRAGGTTMAELTALGVPAILVPLPTAAHDHQRLNASRVAGEGGAILVDQSDLTVDSFAKITLGLLHNRQCLARMSAASLRLGRPAAACNVVNRLLNLLLEQRRHAQITGMTAIAAVRQAHGLFEPEPQSRRPEQRRRAVTPPGAGLGPRPSPGVRPGLEYAIELMKGRT